MRYEINKVAVQATLIKRDDEGRIVGERVSEPQAVFGIAGLREWVDEFEKEVAEMDE